jgi:molybdopterin adenylyltransferase
VTLRIGILSVSDRASRGEYEDRGGPALADAVRSASWSVEVNGIVPDDIEEISSILVAWTRDRDLDVILTTGGTGLGPRDVTPEATTRDADRIIPGIAEAIRATSLQLTPNAMLSRGVAAIRGTTLIINLAGSPKGAVEGFEIVRPVLEHAVATINGGGH